jgi:hypothetical protein
MGEQGKQAVAAFGMYEKVLQASERRLAIGLGCNSSRTFSA